MTRVIIKRDTFVRVPAGAEVNVTEAEAARLQALGVADPAPVKAPAKHAPKKTVKKG